MIIYLILGFILTLSELSVQAEQCGGMLEADNGDLHIQPSNSTCLWIIKLEHETGIRLELKHQTTEPIIVFPEQDPSEPNLQFLWIVGPKNTYIFEGKTLAVLTPSRDQNASLSWSGEVYDSSEVSTTNAKFVKDSKGAMQWQQEQNRTEKTLWAIEPEGTGQFNWTLKADLQHCESENACQCISFAVFQVLEDGNINKVHKTCEAPSAGSLKVEKDSKMLVFLHVNSTMDAGSNLQVTWTSEDKPYKRNPEGLLVGTSGGLYFNALNSSKQIKISTKDAVGLAFDWSSRKVYWSEKDVGIIRANFDGSGFQQLILDLDVWAIAVEPVSGNLYYSSWTKRAIRVCNNNADRCSNLVTGIDGSGVYDIAIHQQKGLIFWSVWKTKIVRANLDGTNMEVVMRGSSYGISLDEHENRIYWADRDNQEIGSCDLNGNDVRMIQEIPSHPIDVEVDEHNIYYTSALKESNLRAITKQGDVSNIFENLPYSTRLITMIGKETSRSVPNPCENVSCTHLCVLITLTTYRCVCPDGEELQDDGNVCSRSNM